MKGNPAAKVTIVEFSDFQCPSCAQINLVIDKLMSEYSDRVKFVVRDFPLSQHKEAFKAAEAAEAAREQGKYWEYSALLFKNQKALSVPKLKEYASQLGIDRTKFDAALESGKFAEKIERDLQDGVLFGVNGTPTLFINGKPVASRTFEELKAALETAIAAQKR
jgi:protein-disulfide isomerase